MKKAIYVLLFSFIFVTCFADWDPGDPAKWVQLPDPGDTGLDVSFTGYDLPSDFYYKLILADDFLCTESGPINKIHIWCSYYLDVSPPVDPPFIIAIYDDIPDPDGDGPLFSKPGAELWSSIDHPFSSRIYFEGVPEGWFDPADIFYEPFSDYYCWQFNFGPFTQPFIQEGTPAAPVVYWLVIEMYDYIDSYLVGWKTSLDHWNDDAVWDFSSALRTWYELRYPDGHPFQGESIDLAFVIEGDDEVPVELSSFSASYSNGSPNLYWTTQSETDNIGWNVYRSETDEIVESMQINNDLIPGAGTTSEPTDYIYEDDYDIVFNNEYWYWIESVDNSGDTDTYGPISLTIPEDGEDPDIPEIPDIYGLHQNYPNPFNPNTRISYRMDVDCVGTLTVYNMKGEKITTLFENREMTADEKGFVEWDSKDDNGNRVSSGVYIYELNTDARDYSRKMVLTK